MRDRQRKIIENFIASLDLDEPLYTTSANVERDIRVYNFKSDEAHQFRVLVSAARIEGKAGVLRDLAETV